MLRNQVRWDGCYCYCCYCYHNWHNHYYSLVTIFYIYTIINTNTAIVFAGPTGPTERIHTKWHAGDLHQA